jgi:hypothetical protein
LTFEGGTKISDAGFLRCYLELFLGGGSYGNRDKIKSLGPDRTQCSKLMHWLYFQRYWSRHFRCLSCFDAPAQLTQLQEYFFHCLLWRSVHELHLWPLLITGSGFFPPDRQMTEINVSHINVHVLIGFVVLICWHFNSKLNSLKSTIFILFEGVDHCRVDFPRLDLSALQLQSVLNVSHVKTRLLNVPHPSLFLRCFGLVLGLTAF